MTPRRTQADRRAATRRALLDATVRSLVELGYAHTTTTEIAARAGVSQGALFKHFPTKEALLSTAAAELCASLFPRFRKAMRTHRSGKDSVERAVRGLWSVFETDEVRVLHELYAAAPTEPALRDALSPVLAAHRANIHEEARTLFPELAALPNYEAAVDLVITSMQGAALVLFTGRDRKRERAFVDGLTLLVRSAPLLLGAATPAGG
ncbi:MAG TPA: helix-turn-helix domain-containing protein [Polyangiaceae bacterium]|nr:helix-turn-helix domain-containing protein [Polyangiaceae bacterium]